MDDATAEALFMTRRTRLRASTATDGDAVSPSEIGVASWPEVDVPALSVDRRALYGRRAQAVRLYLEGATDTMIRSACGMGRGQAYRLLTERCLAQHPDGRVWGWRGLLPHTRTKTYNRTAPLKPNVWGGGVVGALQWLFESPAGRGLEERLQGQILGKRGELESSRRPRLAIFRWFLAELRERGFERRGEWPFNVENGAT
jgi:hypothetical protein